MTIKDLEPKELWENFHLMTQQPRPSKHEEKVRAMLKKFAADHHIACEEDEVGNIIMRKPATPGMENRRGVILQCHMDMVPQKAPTSSHDFENDPIETRIIDGWVWANDTTLGADDGMGDAAIMAIMASNTVQHGPLEALFTVDEETGMTGAFAIKPGLFKGDLLLNLDSETEGELYVGCAGGVDATLTLPYRSEKTPQGYVAYKLTIEGLKGGHSGMEINTGRGNANKILFRHLRWAADCDIRLCSVDGGTLRNAIPREACAVVAMPQGQAERALKAWDQVFGWMKAEIGSADPDFGMRHEKVDLPAEVIGKEDTQKIISLMMCAPNGVVKMSNDVPGLVETSLNLARVSTNGSQFELMALLRSSVDSAKDALGQRLVCLAELAGGSCSLTGAYPGWKPNPKSPLVDLMKKTYHKLYGKEMTVMAIHAGLECGLLGGVYPNWDMVSFGPTILSPHSPQERVNIESCKKFYELLVAVLKDVPVAQ